MSILNKYKNLLKVDDRASQGEVGTPVGLVNEMLDKLPERVFISNSTTFLDPGFGNGTFLIEIVKRLRKYGHSIENIQERVYGTEISHRLYNKVSMLFSNYNFRKLYKEDFLKKDFNNMKFDVVIANPPYQHPTKLQVKLWPHFVMRGIDTLKQDGYLTMVYPSVWLDRPNGQKWKNVSKRFSKLELEYVKVDQDRTWFSVGETTAYVLIKNTERTKDYVTLIEAVDGRKEQVTYVGQKLLQSEEDIIIEGIVRKVEQVTSKLGKLPLYEDLDHNTKKQQLIEDGILSKEKKEGMSSIWYTASQEFFTDSSNINPSWRVLLNMSGHYFQESTDKYQRVTRGEGSTSGMKSVLVESEEQGYNVLSFTSSKLFRFVNNSQKTSGFNTYMIRLPKLDYSKKWNDTSIFSYFEINEKEQNFILNSEYTI